MEGAMSGGNSLTDAVKAVAAHSTSLTDAVKEAARSGADSTVVSFPRLVTEARHDTAVPGVRPQHAPDTDAPARLLEGTFPGPAPHDDLEDAVADPLPAPPRKLRLRTRGPGPLGRLAARVVRLRLALPGA